MQLSTGPANSIYKAITAIGILAAIMAAAFSKYVSIRADDRLFVIETEVSAATVDVTILSAEAGRLKEFALGLSRKQKDEKDTNSPRFVQIFAELEKTAKRLEPIQNELDRKSSFVDLRNRQSLSIQQHRKLDGSRGELLLIVGLTFTVFGVFLWYARVQRFLEWNIRATAARTAAGSIQTDFAAVRTSPEALTGRRPGFGSTSSSMESLVGVDEHDL